MMQVWPETQGYSSKIHVDTATQLITSIHKIVLGLTSVERYVKANLGPLLQGGEGSTTNISMSKAALEAFRTSFDPLDLLDLLDVGQPFGLNSQCHARTDDGVDAVGGVGEEGSRRWICWCNQLRLEWMLE